MRTTKEEKGNCTIETITLERGDSVDRTDCYRNDGTSCKVYGPGVLQRITWKDSGIDIKILKGCQ